MFYILSKAIDFFIMPFSIFFLLSIFAFCVKKYKTKKILLFIAFTWLFATSNKYLVNRAFLCWEHKISNISDLQKTYDVGIVLSGGLTNHVFGSDHPMLGNHADRFSEAFLLYKAGKIKKILITGTSTTYLIKAKKGEVLQASQLLIMWGVKPEDIILEEKARNTHENAAFVAKILSSKFPDGRYLLITSAFHMRRAQGCFEKSKVITDPFSADFYGGNFSFSIKDLLIPDPDAASSFELLWREWIGYIMYKMAGYC